MPTLMIVDNEEHIRRIVSRIGEMVGYDIGIEFPTADAAIDNWPGPESYDAIFTDYRMPGDTDGLDAMRKGRGEGKPVIVSSSGLSDEELEELAKYGADFLEKPFDINVLKKRLELYLSQ